MYLGYIISGFAQIHHCSQYLPLNLLILWKQGTNIVHLQSGDQGVKLLLGEGLSTCLELFCKKKTTSPICICMDSGILFFYTLGHSPVLYCSSCPSFGLGEVLRDLVPVVFLTCLHSSGRTNKVDDGGGREELLERCHQIGEGMGSRFIMVG